ncbi:MAG: hypothetical protein QOJ03_2742, partial [Frankiaceae bacterium]|nr:hypothetical protein [Frankiaceae bacterium]
MGGNVWPLVARQEQLRATADAVAAGSTVVVVSGAPGSGKSHYLQAATARADGERTYDLVVGTADTSTLPFAALAHLIATSEQGQQPSTLPDVVRSLLPTTQRLHLAIDDAHLLDPSSAAVVSALARTRRATIVAATDDQAPTPFGNDLHLDPDVTLVRLQPFDDAAVDELLLEVFGVPP